jgi:hypothetical protein
MYSVRKKNRARNPMNATSWVTFEKPRPLIRKIDSGASGSRCRSSLNTNRASSTTAPASSAIVRAVPQPADGACTSP